MLCQEPSMHSEPELPNVTEHPYFVTDGIGLNTDYGHKGKITDIKKYKVRIFFCGVFLSFLSQNAVFLLSDDRKRLTRTPFSGLIRFVRISDRWVALVSINQSPLPAILSILTSYSVWDENWPGWSRLWAARACILPTRGAGTIYEQTESAVTHNALRKENGASAAKRLTIKIWKITLWSCINGVQYYFKESIFSLESIVSDGNVMTVW